MGANRYVVLGLANVRSAWFRDVGRWATAAAIPVDFVKCVSVEEVRARISSGRSFSALLLGAATSGIDRDLLDVALDSGAAVIVVQDGRSRTNWQALGATSTLPDHFHRVELMDELSKHGRAIGRNELSEHVQPAPGTTGHWSGRLVAVAGGHGSGTSTVAMSLAQGLGADPRFAELTLLADFALNADLAMFHDARDIVPGLQELVEAHRTGTPSASEVRNVVFDLPDRGYHLLLGLRRHRDWSVLRPRAFNATLDSLTQTYRIVVADLEADFEGEDEVGSADVEDRNLLARATARRADLVLAVGTPDLKGLNDLLRVVNDLVEVGVEPDRVLPILNRSNRSARVRAHVAAAFGELVAPITGELPSPLHLVEKRKLEDALRDGTRLPHALVSTVTTAVSAALDRHALGPEPQLEDAVAVPPGSLGHFVGDDEPDSDAPSGDE